MEIKARYPEMTSQKYLLTQDACLQRNIYFLLSFSPFNNRATVDADVLIDVKQTEGIIRGSQ